MVKLNEGFSKLGEGYLFSEIARRRDAYLAAKPGAKLIHMGIGDVTLPLFPAVIKAMHAAVDEMGNGATFRGYGPEQGYGFLREAIAENDYKARGAAVSPDEIFISDGAKSDCASILDLFAEGCRVALCDPVYPVYADSAVISGIAGGRGADGRRERLVYLPCSEANGFVPELPEGGADVVWLCYPNNPTGAVAARPELARWVDWANGVGAVLLFDAAYEAYISDPRIPHSIYEIPGAETCAIEFRSFSKTAGFTGTRCAFTVVPKALVRDGQSLRDMWLRRQATKFNGVSYVVQRGAAAVYSPEGRAQRDEAIRFYKNNAANILKILRAAGLTVSGGENAPYIWVRLPGSLTSWQAFDLLLRKAGVVTTPGSGFGSCGEGYLRLTAFGGAEDSIAGAKKIAELLRSGEE